MFIVTLLGAHSIGHVHPAASGYGYADARANIHNNAWDATPLAFDSDYYGIMVGLVSSLQFLFNNEQSYNFL